MTSFLIKQERCPKCADNGKDTSKDNLGVYSDGHKYCFACGYTELPDGITRFKNKSLDIKQEQHKVFLPSDVSIDYPKIALEWVEQYELDKNTLLKHNVMWSNNKKRLYFPVYGEEELLAYQGRYFGTDPNKKKWWGKGDFKNIFHIIGQQGRSLVLVEDIVSAIKISRFTQAMPLFGNHIGKERFKRLFKLLPRGLELIIWLDPDIRSHSLVQSKIGAIMGLNTRTVFSDGDPKEHTYEEIKNYLSS